MSSPLLAFFGHHKSGTTWIIQVMRAVCQEAGLDYKHAHSADMFDGNLAITRKREGFDVLTYTNADYCYIDGLDVRGFHVVRDPRDLIVSAYFSHLQSHPEQIFPRLKDYRPLLQSTDKATGILLEMEFSSIYMEDMRSWPDNPPGIILVKFEEMIADPHRLFRRVFRHLGLLGNAVGDANLREIVERFSFKALAKGRSPGEENIASHFRKGVAGDWMNHLTPEHVWIFKQRYNDLLVKYDYESNDEWNGRKDVQAVLTNLQRRQLFVRRQLDRVRRVKRYFFNVIGIEKIRERRNP